MCVLVPPCAGKVTVAELAKTYLEARRDQICVRAWESDESVLGVRIVPALGPRPVGSAHRIHSERPRHGREQPVGGTAARLRTILLGLFE
jgi:hypothetical protein